MIKNIKTLIVIILISNTLSAQWSLKKGKGYYKLAFWSVVSDQHYNDIGIIDPNATRGSFVTSLYGEYGITDKWDIIAYIPFFTQNFQNEIKSKTRKTVITKGETLNSLGDTDIAIRYGWLNNKRLVSTVSLKFGLPLGKTEGGSEDAFLQNGDGEFNQLLQFDFGTSYKIKTIPSYSKAYVGFNHRTKGFSNEFHYGAETGFNFFRNKLWLVGRVKGIKSFKDGSLNNSDNNGSLFANNIEYTTIDFETAYYITKKVGLSLGYSSAVSGRIIFAAPSYTGGVFFDYK